MAQRSNPGRADIAVGGESTTTTPVATLTRPATVTPYAVGDEMTDTGGLILQFAGCASAPGQGGTITGLLVTCSSSPATKLSAELRLYHTTSTPLADNGIWNANSTVNRTLVAVLPFSVALGAGASGSEVNCVYDLSGLNILYKCAPADTKLYGRIQVKNAYTPVSGEIWEFTPRLLVD